MRKPYKRTLIAVLIVLAVAAVPGGLYLSLKHQPQFYRTIVHVPKQQREEKAKQFVASSLQLRNDICNEPRWEAVFSDQEVNAWMAEDLVTHFADQLPPEVHEPRVVFEMDRVTLAFELDQQGVSSVITVVALPRVPEPNVLELTLEKIRAGLLPLPAEKIIDRITTHARGRGVDVSWKRVGDLPVVVLRYRPHAERDDVQLDRVQIRDGEIRLAGRSNRSRGVVRAPALPTRKLLQSKFPKRKVQVRGRDLSIAPAPPASSQSAAIPRS